MSEMYFITKQHKINYKANLLRWPGGARDVEYQQACYILAIPMIYQKLENRIGDFEHPIDWIWRWEWAHDEDFRRDHLGLDSNEREEGTYISYDLSGFMVQLGKLSLNLWNGYKYFNLMKCINSLDEYHYHAALCAIDIRCGKHQPQLIK